jgi:nicotinamide-nucleotide amidase
MINASIITIGDELLIGQVIDTNSAWIAQELNKIGYKVERRIAVGDNKKDILKALNQESESSDLIIITGGLGPTADDITKPLLCEYFNGNLIVHQETLKHITTLFEVHFKRPLTERNIKQAEVPDNCQVLFNKRGTAPGMWFEKNGKIFISLPGVPFEMKGLMADIVLPKLQGVYNLPPIEHRTLVTFGIGESALADLIQDFETALPTNLKLAYLPNHGIVRLRLTIQHQTKASDQSSIDSYFQMLKMEVKDYIVAEEDLTMEKIVGNLMIKNNKSLAVAESCTGGYMSHLITSIPGSSDWFKGGTIAYSNDIKISALGVNPEKIINHGAVSEEVVVEMVNGLLQSTSADYGIAASGIMGPSGGTTEKPLGTVWVAVGDKNKIQAQKFHFRFDRAKNIQVTAMNAFNLLRMMLLKNDAV